MNQPLVLDKKKVIIAGHTRYKALLQLGHTEAPCIILDIPTEKARAYRIADNKTSELADWDQKLLIEELRELVGVEQMQPYFGDINVEELVNISTGSARAVEQTQADIEAKEHELQGQFKIHSDKKEGDKVECICPHCNESFYLNRQDILKH